MHQHIPTSEELHERRREIRDKVFGIDPRLSAKLVKPARGCSRSQLRCGLVDRGEPKNSRGIGISTCSRVKLRCPELMALTGMLVFGIDLDEATISPLSDPYDHARDRLTTIIEGNLTDVPPFEVRKLGTAAGLVIAGGVGNGELPPYGVDKQKPVFYIRSNATTLPASAERVRRRARSTLPDRPYGRFPYA